MLFSFWFETLYEIEWMTQKQVRGWYLWLNFVGWLVGGNVQLLWVYIKISSSCKKEKPMDNRQSTKKWIWKKIASGKYVANYKNWEVNLLQRWQMPHLLYLDSLLSGMQIWHLPSLCHIHSSLLHFLRHIFKEQIKNLCKSIFRPVRTFVLFVLQTGFFIL